MRRNITGCRMLKNTIHIPLDGIRLPIKGIRMITLRGIESKVNNFLVPAYAIGEVIELDQNREAA